MCPERANLFKNISFSANTITRRLDDNAETILIYLSGKNRHLK